jgi:hypothetical protein
MIVSSNYGGSGALWPRHLNGVAMSDLVTIVALILGVVSFILYIVETVFALRNKPVEPAKDVMQRAAQAAVQKTPTIDEFNRMIGRWRN